MNIIEKIATANPCYKAGRTINPKGVMIHSVGCSQPDPLVFVKNWQKATAKVCVHAVFGVDGKVYQLLPWNRRGWHCGSGAKGSCNNTHISFEMTEPNTIKYSGGATWKDNNPTKTKEHVLATYDVAVEFTAYLCDKYNLDPLKDGVVISHSEGYKRGLASNHGDVEHIWKKFGLTMDQFRNDVKSKMRDKATTIEESTKDNKKSTTVAKEQSIAGTITVIYAGKDGIEVHDTPDFNASSCNKTHGPVGPGTKKGSIFTVDALVTLSDGNKMYKLKSGLYITASEKYVSFKQKQETIKTGDKVKVTKNQAYNGGTFKLYYDTYDVISLSGDRAVIGKGKTVTAAVNIANLKLA